MWTADRATGEMWTSAANPNPYCLNILSICHAQFTGVSTVE